MDADVGCVGDVVDVVDGRFLHGWQRCWWGDDYDERGGGGGEGGEG